MLRVTMKGMTHLQKALKAESVREKKALEVAIRREGYLLREKLQQEIKAGAPGGRKFAPLSFIARWKTKRFRKSGPLGRLGGRWIRYHVTREPFEMRIGWVQPHATAFIKDMARKHQRGFTSAITPKMRRAIIRRGIERKAKEEDISADMGVAKFHFLRKSTRRFRTPARPILDPFWQRYQDDAWRHIRTNFRRKLRGKHI